MLDHFRQLRGYDARPWLPALTGALIGTRADSDRRNGNGKASPYGIMTLEYLGLGRGPETVLQIADIPQDGIREIDAE